MGLTFIRQNKSMHFMKNKLQRTKNAINGRISTLNKHKNKKKEIINLSASENEMNNRRKALIFDSNSSDEDDADLMEQKRRRRLKETEKKLLIYRSSLYLKMDATHSSNDHFVQIANIQRIINELNKGKLCKNVLSIKDIRTLKAELIEFKKKYGELQKNQNGKYELVKTKKIKRKRKKPMDKNSDNLLTKKKRKIVIDLIDD